MNTDTLAFWLALNVVSFAMVALIWFAHRRHPQRLNRAAAIVRSGVWILFAILVNLSLLNA